MGFPVRHGSARPNLWWSHGIAPLQTDRLFQDPSCMPSSRCLVLLTEICMTIQTEIEQRRKKKPTYNALRRKSYAIPSLFINWSITTALRSEVGSCCKLFIQWQCSFWMKSAPPLVKLLATETDHWALSCYSDPTLPQSFQPMTGQLSMKAALPLAESLATVSCCSNKITRGPSQ